MHARVFLAVIPEASALSPNTYYHDNHDEDHDYDYCDYGWCHDFSYICCSDILQNAVTQISEANAH